MNSFKTPNGTELPLLSMHGGKSQYLEVKYRLVWFREIRPDWSIETEVKPGDKCALGKAVIKNEAGRIMAMAHKYEDVKGFADYIEKAETGAIGRALALCGFGTQFVGDELSEGQRLADAPVQSPRPQAEASLNPNLPDLRCDNCETVLKASTKGGMYCPNFKNKTNGDHTYLTAKAVETIRQRNETLFSAPEADVPF